MTTERDDQNHDRQRHLDRIDRTIAALVAERVRAAGTGPLTDESLARIAALLIAETTVRRDG